MMALTLMMNVDIDIDVIEGKLISLGVLSLLNEPYDQSYPMQAYANQAIIEL